MRGRLLLVLAFLVTGVPCSCQELLVAVDVRVTGGEWAYGVTNLEPTGSSAYVGAFSLTVGAPVEVTGIPEGWSYWTDGSTFVYWYNLDDALPYPHDVAPGERLDGFALRSPAQDAGLLSAGLFAWDHALDLPGPAIALLVPAPLVAVVPEPDGASLAAALTLTALGLLRRRGTPSHPAHHPPSMRLSSAKER